MIFLSLIILAGKTQIQLGEMNTVARDAPHHFCSRLEIEQVSPLKTYPTYLVAGVEVAAFRRAGGTALLKGDNPGSMALAHNLVFQSMTKHIDIQHQ